MAKRQSAKKRADRQTTRRRDRESTIRNKRQIAQDIYESLRTSNGETDGAYRLRMYDFGMFEYGDPVKPSGRIWAAAPKAGNQRNNKRREIKKEQKRKALWGQNIKTQKEIRKKSARKERKKRMKDEVKRAKKTTSRKTKTS